MVDSTWVPVFSAAVGGFFGVAGALGTQALTGRREKRGWERARNDRLRDIRAQLYLDLMEYTQSIEGALNRSTNPDSPGRNPVDGLVHEERLTARVELYIPETSSTDEGVPIGPAEAWRELLAANAALEWTWSEGETERDSYGQQYVTEEYADVVRCRAAIRSMKDGLTLWLARDI